MILQEKDLNKVVGQAYHLRDQVKTQVCDQVLSRVHSQVYSQVWDQVWREVVSQPNYRILIQIDSKFTSKITKL
jgi:hypothetical protein